jgi:hypothetical protein
MSRSTLCAAVGVALVGSQAFAALTITSGLVDTSAVALSGRKGSAIGPVSDDPLSLAGTAGSLTQSASATAGPVLPVDDDHPSFPGTRGIATGSATASVDFVPTDTALIIDTLAIASNSFINMDGGGYLANAAAYFKVTFTLTENTPWSLSGTAAFNAQDPLANLRLVGTFVGSVVNLTAADNGGFDFGGILPAGDYLFEGSAAVGEVPSGDPAGIGQFSESGSVRAHLTLVPTPATATLLALALLAGRRRR